MPKTFKVEEGTPTVEKSRKGKWDDAVKAAIDHPGHTVTLGEVFKTAGLASKLRRDAATSAAVSGAKTPTLHSRSVPVTRAKDDPETEIDESDPKAATFYIVQLWTETSDPQLPLYQAPHQDGLPVLPDSAPVNADGVPVASDGTPLEDATPKAAAKAPASKSSTGSKR